MADETLQLLKAFIVAAGYEIRAELKPSILDGIMQDDKRAIYKVTKKKKKPRQAKESGYSEDFLYFWSIYPKGHGGSKKEAFRQYQARLAECHKEHSVLPCDEYVISKINRGARAYADYVKATGRHVKHPATFLGCDKHYLNDYTIPDQVKKQNKPEWAKLPFDDNQLVPFAQKHGLQQCGKLDTYQQYRAKLKAEINERLSKE